MYFVIIISYLQEKRNEQITTLLTGKHHNQSTYSGKKLGSTSKMPRRFYSCLLRITKDETNVTVISLSSVSNMSSMSGARTWSFQLLKLCRQVSSTCITTTKHLFTFSQFVPFRDYIDRSGNQVLSMARLAKDVLAEIPDQLVSFMKSRGIEPRPAVSSSPLPGVHQHIWPLGHSSSQPLHSDSLSFCLPSVLIYAHVLYSNLSLWRSRRFDQ